MVLRHTENVWKIPLIMAKNFHVIVSLPVRCWPMYAIIHLSNSLSYDRAVASSKKRVLKKMRSSVSILSFQYNFVTITSPSSYWPFLPRLYTNCSLLSIFSSVTYFRRRFLRKMWPIQSAFLLFIVCKVTPRISLWPLILTPLRTRCLALNFSRIF